MYSMNFYTILAIFVISTLGVFTINPSSAEVDPLVDIAFLQTGELNTSENQFHISNEITIREFFNGNIIRVSGQTIEGFPYIIYSKILDDKIDTPRWLLRYPPRASHLVEYHQDLYDWLRAYDKPYVVLGEHFYKDMFIPYGIGPLGDLEAWLEEGTCTPKQDLVLVVLVIG